jgi:transposase
MRGQDHQQSDIFSYLSPEQRVRNDHPLRAIRAMADQALRNMSERFDDMYAKTGRPSIPPEKLLRAQLIQMLYSVRSERLLMEEIDYSVLYRWFVARIWTSRYGTLRCLPRTETGFWMETWRGSF